MKTAISNIHVSCYGKDKYTVQVFRDKDFHYYEVSVESIVFDMLSNMMNRNKVDHHVQMSIYPTFNITPKAKVKKIEVTRESYDPAQARIDLCEEIRSLLNPIYEKIEQARSNEMSFAKNEEVDPQDFDNLRHVVSTLYRLADDVSINAGAQDEYSYETQGKSFD